MPTTTLALQLVLLTAATLTLSPQLANSDPTQDKQALLAFLSTTPHSTRVTWDPSQPTCSWVGVTCDQAQTIVTELRLPGVGLVGPIRPNTVSNLTGLRVLSLRSNSLTGPIPDLSDLKLLRSLYLQGNSFGGELPTGLAELTRLTRLDLSSNRFSGSVPFSLNNLTRLTGLFLENNNFSGNLPSISQPSLIDFNISNNNLNGSVPTAMSRFPATAFARNLNLCGGPLKPCSPFFPEPTPAPEAPPSERGKKRRKGLSAAAIAGIVVGAVVLFILLVVVLILCLRRSKKGHAAKTPKNGPPTTTSRAIAEAGTSSSVDISAEGGADRNKLIFFENGGYSFDLEDLLRASAEVLGKGSVGTSYKAVLEEGTTVVVKRLKDVAVEKREFETVMGVLGKVRNENVVPFRAYYFSKDEKLLVCDFMPAGSLSALLHGSRGSGRTPLDWENRIRIALSTARGLAHLHVSSNVIHGNIKASNILLRSNHEACLSDFGLNQIFGSSTPPNRVAGYRAPEVIETRKVTFKSDVYSFGVLVLELLTGKSPNQASLGEEGIDLPRWVQSVVREEWTAEVFDVELMRYNNIEEEMVQLLQIGMACVSVAPDQRPSMSEVVRMIEEINRGETDDGLRQSSDDPSKGSDGQTPPQRRSPPAVTP